MISAMPSDPLPGFESLPPEARRRIAALGVERRLRTGTVLFRAGTPAASLYVVLEGSVRVTRSSGGRRRVIHTEGPGGTLGEIPFFRGGGYPATATAAEPARVLQLSHRALGAVMRQHPEVAWLFLARLSERARQLIERLDHAQARRVPAQLAQILLDRAPEQRGQPFSLGMTHAELAEEVGTVREVVVRTLRRFKLLGALETRGRARYALRDPAVLRVIADR